ncbi:hypothetical protein SAMN05444273_11615 [Litoreibacter ascidiaceicola]|uniref:Uncharacterized protein n=1 Tax=Litoreibacter ascidiaceicola TaxID=1486859 RepID=A0A1M5EXQ0_9RHOB|nr:hypothetical protein [Litoreibacter ascidiaceicola]SHF83917.1 hypothetical protein SAMN05444273_11615 [Litoreibacter ascidiaceicola]
MPEKLIEFWNRAPLTGPRFIHPDDEPILERKLLAQEPPLRSFDEYVTALRNVKLEARKLHLSLLPQPYLGDLRNAPVVILLLNPGLDANDFYLESNSSEFREELLSSIRQTSTKHIFLDPKWAWTSGFSWWEKKLRGVAEVIAAKKFRGRYGKALDLLAEKVACLEMVPYHSKSFGARVNIPSAIAARDAAKRIARDTNRTVIVTRRVKDWDLPGTDNVTLYNPAKAQSASLGPESEGGKEILKALGAE